MCSKSIKREATEGDILYRWLRGVKAQALTPFFYHRWVQENLTILREAPSGSYYPIVDKNRNRNMKWAKLYRFAQIKFDSSPNKNKYHKSCGTIFL